MSLVSAYLQWLPTIVWWLIVIEAIGLMIFPIVSRIASSLKDRGFFISKAIGLGVITYISYIASFFVGYSSALVFSLIVFIASVSFYVLKKYGMPKVDVKFIKYTEIIFLLIFFVFISLRMFHPYIEGTSTDTLYIGERFMDHGFSKAAERAESFPPNDPWLSGYKLQHYYYFGFITNSILLKITGIPMNILLNLFVATITAMVASMAFGFGYILTRKKKYAIFTMLFFVFFGNLFIAGMLYQKYTEGSLHDSINSHWDYYYWSPTRALFDGSQTINEFPFFASMWGDLHSHFAAFPFQILVIILLYNFILTKRKDFRIFGSDRFSIALTLIVFGILLGYLFAVNSWDYPTYSILSFVLLFSYFLSKKISMRRNILMTLAPFVVSFLLYLPYFLLLKNERIESLAITSYPSPVSGFLYVFGFPLFLIYSFLFLSGKWPSIGSIKKSRVLMAVIAVGALFAVVWSGFKVLAFVLPIIVFSGFSVLNKTLKGKIKSEEILALCVLLTLSLLLLFSEVFYFRGYLPDSPWERMNTVFKLHLEVWIMFGLLSGYITYRIFSKIRKGMVKTTWVFVFSLLVIISSIFPFLGTHAYFKGFKADPTLDGFEYLKERDVNVVLKEDTHVRVKTFPDYYAVKWINENIKGSPVILEAVPQEAPWKQPFDYTYFSRVSAFTGLPTLSGWVFHEFNWGYETDVTEPRIRDANEIYNTTDIEKAMQLVGKYNVSYVYVGVLENLQYPKEGLNKFDQIYEKIYDENGAKIYKVS